MTTDRRERPCDAFILCGGLGSRLKPLIADRPKGLATVHGRTVLDILVDDLSSQGFQKIVFCVGHMHEQIMDHFGARRDIDARFSIESEPLGTGGAIVHALNHSTSENILVMNGDSFCKLRYGDLLEFHLKHSTSRATLAVTASNERKDIGNVTLEEAGRVSVFLEKSKLTENKPMYTNAGVYVLNKKTIFEYKHPDPMSLELNYFPDLVRQGQCFAMRIAGEVIDIGTPERYAEANKN